MIKFFLLRNLRNLRNLRELQEFLEKSICYSIFELKEEMGDGITIDAMILFVMIAHAVVGFPIVIANVSVFGASHGMKILSFIYKW